MSLVSPKAYLCVGSEDACSLHQPRLVLEPLARRKALEFRIPRKPIFKSWTLKRERDRDRRQEGGKRQAGRQGFARFEASRPPLTRAPGLHRGCDACLAGEDRHRRQLCVAVAGHTPCQPARPHLNQLSPSLSGRPSPRAPSSPLLEVAATTPPPPTPD